MGCFLQRWKVELIAAVLAAIGIFLLVERLDLGGTVSRRLIGFGLEIWSAIKSVVDVIRATRSSDALGIALLVAAAVLLIRRAGQRMRQSPSWTHRSCPRCGHGLRRVSRRRTDALTWILPLRRYRCQHCGWSGLRAKPLEPDEIPEPVAGRRSG